MYRVSLTIKLKKSRMPEVIVLPDKYSIRCKEMGDEVQVEIATEYNPKPRYLIDDEPTELQAIAGDLLYKYG